MTGARASRSDRTVRRKSRTGRTVLPGRWHQRTGTSTIEQPARRQRSISSASKAKSSLTHSARIGPTLAIRIAFAPHCGSEPPRNPSELAQVRNISPPSRRANGWGTSNDEPSIRREPSTRSADATRAARMTSSCALTGRSASTRTATSERAVATPQRMAAPFPRPDATRVERTGIAED